MENIKTDNFTYQNIYIHTQFLLTHPIHVGPFTIFLRWFLQSDWHIICFPGYKSTELTAEQVQKRLQKAKRRREQAQEKREFDKACIPLYMPYNYFLYFFVIKSMIVWMWIVYFHSVQVSLCIKVDITVI